MTQGPDHPSSFRNRSAARLIANVSHGLQVNEENRFLLKAWRGNMRTIWSDNDPSPREGLGFGKKRDDAACDAVQAMRDATAADSHGNKATSAALESAKKLQVHADNAIRFLNTAQPLSDVAPDITHFQSATRPRVSMLHHTDTLDVSTVRNAEDTMMNGIAVNDVTVASSHTEEHTSWRPPEPDIATTPELYGAFADITETAFQADSLRWVALGMIGLPPLNPQQRDAGRPNVDYFIKLKKWMVEAHLQRDLNRRPASPQPIAPLIFVHAEPGAGKSVLVEVLCKWLKDFSNDTMKIVCCSYTGSAASLVPQGRTINNLFGFTVEEAGCNKNLHQQHKKNTLKKTATMNELTAMFDLMSNRPWHAVCVVNDEVSQTTVALLGHIEQRMTQVANSLTPDIAFGGHAVTLVGDFFQKTPPGNASIFTSMVDRYVRLSDDHAGTAKQRQHWRNCFENDTPMARGVDVFKKFKMVKLGAQMRSQSDQLHIDMIRNFRDISSDNPCPLTANYLSSILPYSKEDAATDVEWSTAPIAVVGNVERLALSANRIKIFAKRTKQPVLKWKLEIKDCDLNDLIKAMEHSDLETLYQHEEGLWQFFVAGATAVLSENLCVARGLANGTRVVFSSVGYYNKTIHDKVLDDIQNVIRLQGTEVILPGPPDYMIVEVSHKSTEVSRLQDISEILTESNTVYAASNRTDKICIAYRRQHTTPKTCDKTIPLGSRFAHRRGLVKVRIQQKHSYIDICDTHKYS